jgi:hypothetical protein
LATAVRRPRSRRVRRSACEKGLDARCAGQVGRRAQRRARRTPARRKRRRRAVRGRLLCEDTVHGSRRETLLLSATGRCVRGARSAH